MSGFFVGLTIGLSACSTSPSTQPTAALDEPSRSSVGSLPPVLQRMTDDRSPPSSDTVEVWICEVPLDATAPIYGRLPLRLGLTPDGVIDALTPDLDAYLTSVSQGRYTARLVAGGTVAMAVDDDEADCLDAALTQSSPAADVVLAVATAEHATGFPGGRGQQGTAASCRPDAACSANATGRAVVVGASDFHPSNGDRPLLDLIQHELGHSYGWPHSGTAIAGDDRYPSAIDLMSNSAAPRATRPERRDGPLPLAINLYDAGWLTDDELTVIEPGGATELRLVPLDSSDGTRLAVLAIDDHRVLTIEFRRPVGFDDHLLSPGVAVHLVDDSPGTGVMRVQLPVHTAEAPFTDLLVGGDVVEQDGWRIEVLDIGETAHLAIAATDR